MKKYFGIGLIVLFSCMIQNSQASDGLDHGPSQEKMLKELTERRAQLTAISLELIKIQHEMNLIIHPPLTPEQERERRETKLLPVIDAAQQAILSEMIAQDVHRAIEDIILSISISLRENEEIKRPPGYHFFPFMQKYRS